LKPLEASSSEDEDDDEEEEEDEEEEDEDADQARSAVEDALTSALKRGKTGTFKEIIDHATAVGIAEDKIAKAEAALEQHKAQRKREAFEADLKEFMESEEADNMAACEEREQQGLKFGVLDRGLQVLRDKIVSLQLRQDLVDDEVAQARLFLETCTRRFIKSAVKGRPSVYLDLESGKKTSVNIFVDLTLRFLIAVKTSGDKDEFARLEIGVASAKRAAEVEEVRDSDIYGQLGEEDRARSVAILGGDNPWLLVEGDVSAVDEVIIALTLIGGGNGEAAPRVGGGAKKGGEKAGGKKRPKKLDEFEEDGDKPLISPRVGRAHRPSRTTSGAEEDGGDGGEKEKDKENEKEKKVKKDKNDKNDKKDKKDKKGK